MTLGCGDACALLPAWRFVDWDLPNLSGLDMESAWSVCTALAGRVDALAQELLGAQVTDTKGQNR